MSRLLQHLQALSPGSIFPLADQRTLLAAGMLFRTGAFSKIQWRDAETLVFNLSTEAACPVLAWVNGERMQRCTCGKDRNCKHVLAALMLCTHLLRDAKGFGIYPSPRRAMELKAALLQPPGLENGSTKAPAASAPDTARPATSGRTPASLQEFRRPHLLIRCRLNGLLLEYSMETSVGHGSVNSRRGLPPLALRHLFADCANIEDGPDSFWAWFSDPQRSLPVLVANREGLWMASATEFQPEAGLRLETSGGRVHCSPFLTAGGVPIPDEFQLVGGHWYFLPRAAQLGRLANADAWQALLPICELFVWKGLDRALGLPCASGEMPRQGFNEALLRWDSEVLGDEARRCIRLLHDGREENSVMPVVKAQSCLEVCLPGSEPGREDEVQITVRMTVLDEDCAAPTEAWEEMFGLVCEWDGRGSDHPTGEISAKLDALATILLAGGVESAEPVLKQLRANPVFRTKYDAELAVEQVEEAAAAPDDDGRILWASADRGLLLVDDPRSEAARIVALLWLHLRAWDYIDDFSQGCLLVVKIPVKEALAGLSKVCHYCRVHDIRLFVNGGPARWEKVEISVRSLLDKAYPDWFELRPEVRHRGTLIDQETWLSILKTGGFRGPDGEFIFVDEGSLEQMDEVESLLSSQRAEFGSAVPEGKKGRKAPVHVPRLRMLDWISLAKRGVHCDMPAEERQVLEAILGFHALPPRPLPESLRAALRPYQHDGYAWMAFLYENRFGACLADDMGLGKTVQTITLLAAATEGAVRPAGATGPCRPHLIVLPPTLLFNWRREIETFCPALKIHEYTGADRSLDRVESGVILTTYEVARRDVDKLASREFEIIVFDEAQAVKNFTGERAQAMRRLSGRFKLCLTGTPLENHAGEYFSIMDLALPGIFGSYKRFMKDMRVKPGERLQGVDLLGRAAPFILRRVKVRILDDLPPKVESDTYLELSDSQRSFYTRIVAEVRREVLAAYEDKSAQAAGMLALSALIRLRQVCVSPALMDPAYAETAPKIDYLCGKLRELSEEGHGALVFSSFRRALDLVEKEISGAGIPLLRLDGTTPQPHRRKLVDAFQSGKGPGVFLISLKTGGAGLNLTRAGYVFHLDPWWNPAAENQATDRAHRIGQKQRVLIQRLLMRHTVEEKIMEWKAHKKQLFDDVLAGAEGRTGTGSGLLTRDDFAFLLQ